VVSCDRFDEGGHGMSIERSSRLASLAALVAGAGAATALVGVVCAHFAVVAPFTGFRAFLLGNLFALIGLILGAFGLRATRRGVGGRDRAWFAVIVGALALGLLLAGALPGRDAPRINDFTTNPADPPTFEYATRDPETRARDYAYPPGFAEQQRVAYPDLAPIQLAVPPREAYEVAKAAAESLGWHITLSDPARGVIEARDTSKLFRFVDDVAIRIRPGASGGSVVDIRSKSRDGQGDMGVNTKRIRTFTSKM
jgi:uncharacterized protein (DUF1499 family)